MHATEVTDKQSVVYKIGVLMEIYTKPLQEKEPQRNDTVTVISRTMSKDLLRQPRFYQTDLME